MDFFKGLIAAFFRKKQKYTIVPVETLEAIAATGKLESVVTTITPTDSRVELTWPKGSLTAPVFSSMEALREDISIPEITPEIQQKPVVKSVINYKKRPKKIVEVTAHPKKSLDGKKGEGNFYYCRMCKTQIPSGNKSIVIETQGENRIDGHFCKRSCAEGFAKKKKWELIV